MSIWSAERGQAIQIGAILLFGILVLLLSTYQAVIVPQQNEEVESEHNRLVQSQLQEVRNAIVSIVGGGPGESVDVKLGTTYPSRAIFVNPGPPTGTIRTVGTTNPLVNMTLANAATDGDAGDFWNGTRHHYSTGGLVYGPAYNLFSGPDTAYENSVIYNRFGESNLTLSGQSLIQGSRLRLVTLNGSLSTGRVGTETLDVRPVTSSTREIVVTNTGSSNLTISVPTALSEATWRELVRDELVANGGHVLSVRTVPFTGDAYPRILRISLERGVSYRLQMAQVGVGTDVRGSTSPAYVTRIRDPDSVAEGTQAQFAVEVRDSYNNPVAGVAVEASTERSDSSITRETTTDSAGKATFTYQGPNDIDGPPVSDTIRVSYRVDPAAPGAGFDAGAPSDLSIGLTVENADRSGLGGSGGPAYRVDWRSPAAIPGAAVSPAKACSQIPCDRLTLAALTSPGSAGNFVAFGTNNSSVATLSPGSGLTDETGIVSTGLGVGTRGTAVLFASNTSGTDRLYAETVINESFEAGSGQFAEGGSTEGPTGVTSAEANRGGQSFQIFGGDGPDGGWVESGPYNTSEAALVSLEYWTYTDGTETSGGAASAGPENLHVEYRGAGGQWEPVDTRPAADGGDAGPYFRRALISAGDAMHESFAVRFRMENSTADDEGWYVDDVHATVLGNVTHRAPEEPNTAPSASFTYSPSSPSPGETVSFDPSGSSDSDGSIQSFQWDFEDDGTVDTTTSSSSTVTNTFGAGTHTVQLTVVDDDGARDSTTRQVSVSPNGPPSVNDITTSPAMPKMTESFTLIAQASDPDGDALEYSWDLDDDGNFDDGTGRSISHSEPLPGGFNSRLQVSDPTGAADSYSESITVEGLVSLDDAVAEQGSESADSVVRFGISNPGSGVVEITALTVDNVDGANPDEMFELEGNINEIMIDGDDDGDCCGDSNDGSADDFSGFAMGETISLDSTADVSAGSDAQITFWEFVERAGQSDNRSPIDMSNTESTIFLDVVYQDNTSDTIAMQRKVS